MPWHLTLKKSFTQTLKNPDKIEIIMSHLLSFFFYQDFGDEKKISLINVERKKDFEDE